MNDKYVLNVDREKFYPHREQTCFEYSISQYFNGVLKMLQDTMYRGSFQYSVVSERTFNNRVKVKVHIFDVQCESGEFLKFQEHIKSVIKQAEYELLVRSHILSYGIDVCINIEAPVECSHVDIEIKFKEVDNMLSVPEVKEIIHNISKKKGEVFTVVWADNTETSVKLMKGDTSDEYVAFMYCVSIKMFGSKGDCKKYVKEKKQAFSDRIERRSQELKNNRERKKLEQISKKEVPYAGGLIVPQLSASSMFKKNGGK